MIVTKEWIVEYPAASGGSWRQKFGENEKNAREMYAEKVQYQGSRGPIYLWCEVTSVTRDLVEEHSPLKLNKGRR